MSASNWGCVFVNVLSMVLISFPRVNLLRSFSLNFSSNASTALKCRKVYTGNRSEMPAYLQQMPQKCTSKYKVDFILKQIDLQALRSEMNQREAAVGN